MANDEWLLEVVDDIGEDALNAASESNQRSGNHDRDQRDDQSVLNQGLALFSRALDEIADGPIQSVHFSPSELLDAIKPNVFSPIRYALLRMERKGHTLPRGDPKRVDHQCQGNTLECA